MRVQPASAHPCVALHNSRAARLKRCQAAGAPRPTPAHLLPKISGTRLAAISHRDPARFRPADGLTLRNRTLSMRERHKSWIVDCPPEDETFWETRDKRIARRNLIWSIVAEHL